MQTKEVEGILEITDKGYGFLRQMTHVVMQRPNDPFVSRDLISRNNLREGLLIKATAGGVRNHIPQTSKIISINGQPTDNYLEITKFEDFTVIDPHEHIKLETGPEPLSTRVMDLLTPIGKGQRGLIVAPPRAGKTILLQQISSGVAQNHPEIHIIVLLVDERPEEVTDMRRNIPGEVVASSNDKNIASHVLTARLTIEKAKRMVEFGKDVLVLLDSLTRLGRAYNSWTTSSGRTMSGGVDIRALQLPKMLFGSARKVENGGSLTILATALIDTGSRMDEVIFQEFKGTGNMEMVLDRDLANRRVFPALDISQSGTRKEELLIPSEKLAKIVRLRRHLDSLSVGQDTITLVRTLQKHPSNDEFLSALP